MCSCSRFSRRYFTTTERGLLFDESSPLVVQHCPTKTPPAIEVFSGTVITRMKKRVTTRTNQLRRGQYQQRAGETDSSHYTHKPLNECNRDISTSKQQNAVCMSGCAGQVLPPRPPT